MGRIQRNDPRFAPSYTKAIHRTVKVCFSPAPPSEALLTKPTFAGKKRKMKAEEGAEVIINDNKNKRKNKASETGSGSATQLLGEKKKKKKEKDRCMTSSVVGSLENEGMEGVLLKVEKVSK